jgi:hypothetical protein
MSEKLLAAGSVTLMAAGSLLGATSAQAATAADCGTHPGATVTLINGTICEVLYDTVGEHSFDAPASVTAFEAVVIGGGTGATKQTVTSVPSILVKLFGYSGGMGHYEYEDVTGALDVVVGAGGENEWSYTESGGETLYYDQGTDGEDSSLGEDIGSGASWREYENGCTWDGDALSEEWLVGTDNPLFPVIPGAKLMAASGDVYETSGELSELTYGSGGSWGGSTYQDGQSGAVIIRYNLPAKLASTGVDASAIGIGAGALLAGGVALGAVAAVRRARSKN